MQPPAGYVGEKPLLTLMRLLPPPPEADSSEDKADRFLYGDSRRGIGGPEWKRAIGQLSVTSPSFVKEVSCALGAKIGPQSTPATMALLRRAGADLSRSVYAAKEYYKRARPFTTDNNGKGGGKACDPDAAVNGGKALGYAYPSGHAAVGWLWGMLLSDARPERSAALLKFGKSTGDLRIACRVLSQMVLATSGMSAGIASRTSLTQARSSSASRVWPSPVEPPTARLSARSRTRNSTWLRMDFGISSPEEEKGVVIGAMTPKGTLSGMIMGGCGKMFDLA
jgi:acid phosphatase (class A)